jgi:hypothetical protein
MEQLTLFPWWDEHASEFDAMYRCNKCLPKARQRLLKQLAKKEEMLSSFVNFASQRVAAKQLVAPRDGQEAGAFNYARRVLDEIVSHEAYVQKP